MIKRPLNPRFSDKVLNGTKFTTIRDHPWPAYKDIMLYNWSGTAYRSKQIDVCPVVVIGFWPIVIVHQLDGKMLYGCGMEHERPLWSREGFDSQEEMDEWFRKAVKKGDTVFKHLMRFKKLEVKP
jgi:hypothetical protein